MGPEHPYVALLIDTHTHHVGFAFISFSHNIALPA